MEYDEDQMRYIQSDLTRSTLLYATAGSGKTRCLVGRVRRILQEETDPWIVCVTFTRNAAREMKLRILGDQKLTEGQKERLLIKTIDSLAKRFVQGAQALIAGREPLPCEYSRVFLSLLDEPTFAKTMYAGKNVFLFVDEFQDVNSDQYAIARKYVEIGAKVNVVGDDMQSIYAFRGSSNRFMRQFREETPGVQTFCLSKNYRCSRTVLRLCNEVVADMRRRYPIYAEKPDVAGSHPEEGSAAVRTFEFQLPQQGQDSELSWICEQFVRLRRQQAAAGDFVVLARNVAPIQHFLFQLERRLLDFGLKINIQSTDVVREEIQVKKDAVSVMSIHQAKGLEWKYVFIVGGSTASPSDGHNEEEDRLLYVAVTRAIKEVYISASKKCVFSLKSGTTYPCERAFLLPFLSIFQDKFTLKCSRAPRKDWTGTRMFDASEAVREINQNPEAITHCGLPDVSIEPLASFSSPVSLEDCEFAANENLKPLAFAVLKEMVFVSLAGNVKTVTVLAPDAFAKNHHTAKFGLNTFRSEFALLKATQVIDKVLTFSKCSANAALEDTVDRETRALLCANMEKALAALAKMGLVLNEQFATGLDPYIVCRLLILLAQQDVNLDDAVRVNIDYAFVRDIREQVMSTSGAPVAEELADVVAKVVGEHEVMRGRMRFTNADFGRKSLDFLLRLAEKSRDYVRQLADFVKLNSTKSAMRIEHRYSRQFKSEHTGTEVVVSGALDVCSDSLFELRFAHRKDAKQEWLFRALVNGSIMQRRPTDIVVIDVLAGQAFVAKFAQDPQSVWLGIEQTLVNAVAK